MLFLQTSKRSKDSNSLFRKIIRQPTFINKKSQDYCVKTLEIVEENLYITNHTYPKETHSCTKCGKQLMFFIAYIPSVGDACMECYIEAAKKDEANTLP